MAPTAALVTVREPDGRTVYINQERMAELFIQALGDQYRHRAVPGDGITQRLTVIEAALRVQAAAAPADGLGIPPSQLSAVISALRTLNAVTNHAKHVFSADAAGTGCGPCKDAGEGGTDREVPPPHAGHPLENDSTGHFLEYDNTAADGSTVDKLVGVTTADVAPMAAAPKGDMHCAGGTAGGGAARKWTCTACSTSHSVKKQACRRCGLGRPHLHPCSDDGCRTGASGGSGQQIASAWSCGRRHDPGPAGRRCCLWPTEDRGRELRQVAGRPRHPDSARAPRDGDLQHVPISPREEAQGLMGHLAHPSSFACSPRDSCEVGAVTIG